MQMPKEKEKNDDFSAIEKLLSANERKLLDFCQTKVYDKYDFCGDDNTAGKANDKWLWNSLENPI